MGPSLSGLLLVTLSVRLSPPLAQQHHPHSHAVLLISGCRRRHKLFIWQQDSMNQVSRHQAVTRPCIRQYPPGTTTILLHRHLICNLILCVTCLYAEILILMCGQCLQVCLPPGEPADYETCCSQAFSIDSDDDCLIEAFKRQQHENPHTNNHINHINPVNCCDDPNAHRRGRQPQCPCGTSAMHGRSLYPRRPDSGE